ncbi:MAG: holo-ACP synthase [bacterium]
MIYGIGIDAVQIERIKKATQRWQDRFLLRIFTKAEIAYCQEKVLPYQHLAGRFAAKEAVIKAIGIGWPIFSLTDIEILSSFGPPEVRLNNKAERIVREKGISHILVSISHTDGRAEAIAICQ